MSEQSLQKVEQQEPGAMDRHAGPLDMEPAAFRAGLDRRKENRKALMEWIRAALVENVDFGRIDTKRGKSKPSLFKPGAEKICGMLGIISTFPTLNEYEQCALKGIEIKSVVLRCALLDSRGVNVAEGVGARSLAQDYGDLNKALKMAEKSAHIDATLRMAGLSEVFTQDLEDLPPSANVEPERKANVPQRTSVTPATSKQKPPEPARATEKTRVWFLGLLAPVKEAATAYGWEHGWMQRPEHDDPGEPLELMDLKHVPTTKAAAQAILAEIKARMDAPGASQTPADAESDVAEPSGAPEGDYEPSGGNPDGIETVVGKLEAVSEKSGTSKQGKWVRYGLKIGDEWYGTFDKILGEVAKKDKNHVVRIQFRPGEKGNDLVSIERPTK